MASQKKHFWIGVITGFGVEVDESMVGATLLGALLGGELVGLSVSTALVPNTTVETSNKTTTKAYQGSFMTGGLIVRMDPCRVSYFGGGWRNNDPS